MAERDLRISRDLAQKWLSLAMRRRDHLAQLYQSGRWRRYFSDNSFVTVMRDAVGSVEHWSRILKSYPAQAAAADPSAKTVHDASFPDLPDLPDTTIPPAKAAAPADAAAAEVRAA